MAIVGLNLVATESYVSDLDAAKGTDQEKAEATFWKLGALDSRVQAHVRDKSTKFAMSQKEADGGEATIHASMAGGQAAFERVQLGLKGWENFQDERGNQIAFETRTVIIGGKKYEEVLPDLVALIHPDVILELSQRIADLNTVKEDEKNV